MTRPPQQPAFDPHDSPSFRRSFERWRATLSAFAAPARLRCDDKAAWDQGAIMQGQQPDADKSDRDRKRDLADCRRCEKWRDELARESPIVRFMLQHISLLPPAPGSTMPAPEQSDTPHLPLPVTCQPCPPTMAGGYSSELGILLCQNRFMSRAHVEDALAHELVHAWDERRFKPRGKWGEDLRAHACTEIRAENLSGDCRFGREFTRRNWHFTKQHQACVRRRAILSVAANPNCKSKDEAERVVNEVFESCWPDTRPFDEIY
ncbi:putative metalloprotease [Rhodotorula paludigena]|uniref:putative metalloprotease n=1 Tax=Rhodotorula paludigena TaxID=86838 RepID=UPI00317389D7